MKIQAWILKLDVHALVIPLLFWVSATNGESAETKQQAIPAKKQSFEEIQAAAEKGNATAQFDLGLRFYHAQGLPQNYDEAAKWFKKAAAQGHALAQLNLGVCYGQGQGVLKDNKKAAELFRPLAEDGDAEAQGLLGALYANGEGVPNDDVESLKWFSLAASQGQEDAVRGRDAVRNKLTKVQLLEAEKRIREFLAKNATSTNSTSVASAFQTYKNAKFNFQISHPKDWRTSPQVDDARWKISKTVTNEMGMVSISVARYTGGDDSFLQKYLDQDESTLQETLRQRFPDGRILEKGKTFLGSFPAIYFKNSYNLKNFNSEFSMIAIQIMCIRNGLLYVVTFETPQSSYQKSYPQFQGIISTFMFH